MARPLPAGAEWFSQLRRLGCVWEVVAFHRVPDDRAFNRFETFHDEYKAIRGAPFVTPTRKALQFGQLGDAWRKTPRASVVNAN